MKFLILSMIALIACLVPEDLRAQTYVPQALTVTVTGNSG